MPTGPPNKPKQTVTDPICLMEITPEAAAGSFEYKGRRYYFCSPFCLERFQESPAKFLEERPGAPAPPSTASLTVSSPNTEYVCPMDPDVRQPGPGPCPKCGMGLEPASISLSATKTEYVCPMHPEIVRAAPGSCPICGMALEPRTVSAGEEINPELIDMTRRFRISLALTLPLLLLSMSDLVPGNPLKQLISGRLLAGIQFVLATPVVLW